MPARNGARRRVSEHERSKIDLGAAVGRQPREKTRPVVVKQKAQAHCRSARARKSENVDQAYRNWHTIGWPRHFIRELPSESTPLDDRGKAGAATTGKAKASLPTRSECKAGLTSIRTNICIGRGPPAEQSKWASPFRLQTCATREDALSASRAHQKQPKLVVAISEG